MEIYREGVGLVSGFLKKRFQITFQESSFAHSRSGIQHDLQQIDVKQILINDSWCREHPFKQTLPMHDRINIQQDHRHKAPLPFGQSFSQPTGNPFQLVLPIGINNPFDGLFQSFRDQRNTLSIKTRDQFFRVTHE